MKEYFDNYPINFSEAFGSLKKECGLIHEIDNKIKEIEFKLLNQELLFNHIIEEAGDVFPELSYNLLYKKILNKKVSTSLTDDVFSYKTEKTKYGESRNDSSATSDFFTTYFPVLFS